MQSRLDMSNEKSLHLQRAYINIVFGGEALIMRIFLCTIYRFTVPAIILELSSSGDNIRLQNISLLLKMNGR